MIRIICAELILSQIVKYVKNQSKYYYVKNVIRQLHF